MKRGLRYALPALLLAGLASAAELPPMQTHDAVYELSSGVVGLGEARFTLTPGAAEGCFRYQYTATPHGMAKLFVGEIREFSDFCLVENGIRSDHYEFHRADKASKDFSLDFDWKTLKVRGGKAGEQVIPQGALDRLALQQAVRLWVIAHAGDASPGTVDFSMADNKRISVYRFAITGREIVEVPAGKFDTVLVQRIDRPKKVMRFWLAPERDYMPVKVQTISGDDPELRMLLK
jgi:hypothetical protein